MDDKQGVNAILRKLHESLHTRHARHIAVVKYGDDCGDSFYTEGLKDFCQMWKFPLMQAAKKLSEGKRQELIEFLYQVIVNIRNIKD